MPVLSFPPGRPKRWDWARVNLGASWFLVGLLKKLAIADRMAQFADPVFADPGQYSTGAVWIAMLAYALQIYCDFSGYSDMAIGSAHMFGYKLAVNFNLPYPSGNIAEFWRRWHISLSTWLRDYLFIPLGGNRGSRAQTARNLFPGIGTRRRGAGAGRREACLSGRQGGNGLEGGVTRVSRQA